MLRSDMHTIVAFIKKVRKTVSNLSRGVMLMDAANFSASGYSYADLQLVGTFSGIIVVRSAALGNDYIDYYDLFVPGTPNLVHETLLISDTGAFTVADQTYTDNGKCGVFAGGGGENIVVVGSTSNDGQVLTASATANTVVATAGWVEEADAPMTTFSKIH